MYCLFMRLVRGNVYVACSEHCVRLSVSEKKFIVEMGNRMLNITGIVAFSWQRFHTLGGVLVLTARYIQGMFDGDMVNIIHNGGRS